MTCVHRNKTFFVCGSSAPVRVEREGGAAAWLVGTLKAPSVQGHRLPPQQEEEEEEEEEEGRRRRKKKKRSCSVVSNYYSVHGIFKARVLEWVAISFSRGSSQPRDRTRVSRIAGRRFTVRAIWPYQSLFSSLW